MQPRLVAATVAAIIASTAAWGLLAVPAEARAVDGSEAMSPSAHAALWSPPVTGDVVREFAPSVSRFGAGGHAGLDYRAVVGTPVRSAGAGVVSFTGQVAGSVYVVVLHGPELRTTYAPMGTVRVRRGDRVARGDVLGATGDDLLKGHRRDRLHFGLRRGDVPLDPRLLFGVPDLTEVVRLVPAEDLGDLALSSVQEERSLLTRSIGAAAGAIGGAARLRAFSPSALGTRALVALGGGMADRVTQGECTRESRARAHRAETGRTLVAVGGLNSEWDGRRPAPFELPTAALGYGPDEVRAFSYAGTGGAYGPGDTHVGPEVGARRLAEQMAAYARHRPGEAVDLIGHSQGGVVVEAFLKSHYRQDPARYPPIGSVVTLAAPHRGAPLASTAHRLASTPPGMVGAAGLAAISDAVPGPGSGSVSDLAPGSDFIARLRATPLPAGIRMTTIGGTDDVVVPASRTALDGAEHVVVNPRGWSDHSAILTDPESVAAVGLALAGAPPPCVGLPDAVRHRLEASMIELLTP